MKSIRLSLVVYFLLLLAGAGGAAAALVYQTTVRTLDAKEQAAQQLVQAQYEERLREEQDKDEEARQALRLVTAEQTRRAAAELDEALLFQARTLASMAQVQIQGSRFRFQGYYALGLLSAGLAPSAYAAVPFWIAESTPGRLAFRVSRLGASEIQIEEDELPGVGDGQLPEFSQINLEWGVTWRSESLGKRFLPLGPEVAALPLLDWRFDDLELRPGGLALRRVVLKAPASRFRYLSSYTSSPGSRRPWPSNPFPRGEPRPEGAPPPRLEGPPMPRPEPPPPVERVAESASPPLVVQCAASTEQRDAAIAQLREQLQRGLAECDQRLAAERSALAVNRDEQLAALRAESAATLAGLRQRLLLIGLATFAATVLGGYGLVGLGLVPLRRLSEAVSQVSEKDFRLAVAPETLPGELRPIARRLTQTLNLLQRAFAREKQAAADISHELRTPLAALLTTVEVALRKRRTSEEYTEVLGDCRTLGQQMSQLVERLLALARLDAGVDVLRAEPVDVAELAAQCAALVRPLAEARSLRLWVHSPGPAELTADPDKLREVLTNLLHNAIEYNRPGGEVALTVQRRDGCLQLEVRDTGIGIDPQDRRHIFERFYRADPARAATGLHAGLGLAIVKGYVELMGGSIQVESDPGQGSTFRVQLPAAGNAARKQCGMRNAECGMEERSTP